MSRKRKMQRDAPPPPAGRTLAVGAGKAAAAMALAVEQSWPPQARLDGLRHVQRVGQPVVDGRQPFRLRQRLALAVWACCWRA